MRKHPNPPPGTKEVPNPEQMKVILPTDGRTGIREGGGLPTLILLKLTLADNSEVVYGFKPDHIAAMCTTVAEKLLYLAYKKLKEDSE